MPELQQLSRLVITGIQKAHAVPYEAVSGTEAEAIERRRRDDARLAEIMAALDGARSLVESENPEVRTLAAAIQALVRIQRGELD